MPSKSRGQVAPSARATTTNLVSQRSIMWLLGGLAMIGPLSVDAYLPAFDNIQTNLHVNAASVQFTLSTYLASFAVMSLWHGAVSDALGRRRVILASLLLFALASLACAFATDIHWLAGFRILHGASAGAGTVVGRAIVRDLYEGNRGPLFSTSRGYILLWGNYGNVYMH